MNDGPGPAFDHAPGWLEGGQRSERNGKRSPGHALDGLADQPGGLPRLFDSDQGPRPDVTRGEDGHAEGQLSVGREGMVAAHIRVDARRPRRVAQHHVITRRARREHSRAFEPVLDEARGERQRRIESSDAGG